MNISEFFSFIGAPLANSRWSWGGVRPDGTVILRAWQDERIRKDGTTYLQLTNHEFFAETSDNLGYQERNHHLNLVKNGAKCLVVLCRVVDPKVRPRQIASFIRDDLFVGGELLSLDGDYWIAVVDRQPWRQLL